MDSEFLTSPETAKLIHRESQTLREWRTHGKGPRYIRTGDGPSARVLYAKKDVLAWLGQRTFASTAEEHAKQDKKGGAA